MKQEAKGAFSSSPPLIHPYKMLTTSTADLSQNSIQIKQDDKFFSRLLSKETSMANPSFRVYYGGVAGAVPFLWESQPGTPKCKIFTETTLPPLTPPPSYYSNSLGKPSKKHSRSSLLHILFPKMNPKKRNNVSPSPSNCSSSLSSSKSWSSSSNLSMVVPITSTLKKYRHARSRFSSRASSFDSRIDDEDSALGSPTSTLCFNIGSRRSTGGDRGRYGW